MSIEKTIGLLVGVFVVVSMAGKWLLNDWHKKKLIIQELEAQNQQALFDKIDKDLNALGDKSRKLDGQLRDHAKSITRVTAKLEVMAGILNTSLNVSKAIGAGHGQSKPVVNAVDRMKNEISNVQKGIEDMKDGE